MSILWLVTLIQTLFYISYEKYRYLILFILSALLLKQISKDERIFLLIPILFTYCIYLYVDSVKEGFGIGKKELIICKRFQDECKKDKDKILKMQNSFANETDTNKIKKMEMVVKKMRAVYEMKCEKSKPAMMCNKILEKLEDAKMNNSELDFDDTRKNIDDVESPPGETEQEKNNKKKVFTLENVIHE